MWQELIEYQSVAKWSSSGSKSLIEFLNIEFVMIFLIGLNEAYISLQTHILLMNPLLLTNKVFSLVIQEEHQRVAGKSSSSPKSLTLLATTDNSKRGNNNWSKKIDGQRTTLICSHYSTKDHVVDRCYKLHGYLHGYKFGNSNSRQNLKPQAVDPNSTHSKYWSQGQLVSLFCWHEHSSHEYVAKSFGHFQSHYWTKN